MKKPGTSKPFLFGMEQASHDFSSPDSLGKNIFTNAFPIAVAQYLSNYRKLCIPVIKAKCEQNAIFTEHELASWENIIGTDPDDAHFLFEEIYSGFRRYTDNDPNKSDLVVADTKGNHCRPFEVKLVVVPNSQTATRSHEEQSCEIVVRPPTVEQLAFSLANSYGAERRTELLDIITDCLGRPMDYQWSNESWMQSRIIKVLKAANKIVQRGIDLQTPFAITAIWRTVGQKPILEENAFDVFVWTDMAFLQLFTDKIKERGDGVARNITRPERSVVWLVSALFDYAAQRTLNFSKHHSQITYGTQTDKAGSFAGDVPLKHLKSQEFYNPRIKKSELENIVMKEAFDHLMPERRLDSTLLIQHIVNLISKGESE
ncbi:MAG: HindVP family restriction endonuclease [Clostridiaceae bacterium]|nr:HindVP family restriction endonuclease [Clostridiaceae bacterium]